MKFRRSRGGVFSGCQTIDFREEFSTTDLEESGFKKNMNEMKLTVLWDAAPRSLVEVYRRCRGAYCLHHEGHVHTLRSENLKS
jgi:hypothetical protein